MQGQRILPLSNGYMSTQMSEEWSPLSRTFNVNTIDWSL
jgi:hypothetical protein